MQIKINVRFHLETIRVATVNKDKQQFMMARIWRKTHPLLMGVQPYAATVEIIVAVLQE